MVLLSFSFLIFNLFQSPDLIERLPAKPYDGTAIVYELEISPSRVATPILKYELTPPFVQRKPGNAAAAFEAATLVLPKPLEDREEQFRKEMLMNEWKDMRPKSLQLDRIQRELKPFNKAIQQTHEAAFLKAYDWVEPKPQTIKLLNSQKYSMLRKLMDPLSLQVKVDLGAGRFDECMKSIQAIYQLGEHLSSGPNLMTVLVGIAMTAIGHNSSVDWISMPNSPNLYWAFATRKRPLLDPRPMLVGEAEITADMFKIFRKCDRDPMTEEEIKTLQKKGKGMQEMLDWSERFSNALFNETKFNSASHDFIDLLIGSIREVTFAQQELIARGRNAELVYRMNPTQVVYLSTWLRMEELRQKSETYWLLPLPEAVQAFHRMEEEHQKWSRTHPWDRTFLKIGMLMSPAWAKVHSAQVRIERQFDMLQTIEAIRLHAAETGSWPEKLTDIKHVPVPNDPATGKPYEFTRKGNKIELLAPPAIVGEKPSRGNSLRYDLTLRPIEKR